jgi:hypothetical protein
MFWTLIQHLIGIFNRGSHIIHLCDIVEVFCNIGSIAWQINRIHRFFSMRELVKVLKTIKTSARKALRGGFSRESLPILVDQRSSDYWTHVRGMNMSVSCRTGSLRNMPFSGNAAMRGKNLGFSDGASNP